MGRTSHDREGAPRRTKTMARVTPPRTANPHPLTRGHVKLEDIDKKASQGSSRSHIRALAWQVAEGKFIVQHRPHKRVPD